MLFSECESMYFGILVVLWSVGSIATVCQYCLCTVHIALNIPPTLSTHLQRLIPCAVMVDLRDDRDDLWLDHLRNKRSSCGIFCCLFRILRTELVGGNK